MIFRKIAAITYRANRIIFDCIATRPHISFVSGRRAGSGEMSICGIGDADLPVIALTDIDRCMVALPSAETMAEF
jgi:hypothetical protein